MAKEVTWSPSEEVKAQTMRYRSSEELLELGEGQRHADRAG